MEENVVMDEKKEKNKALIKKILVIAGNVVFYAVVILLFLFSLMNINAGNGTENFPNLFGKGFLSVETNSMERNGNTKLSEWEEYSVGEIKTGDLVNVDVFNGDVSSLKVGDVITFAGTIHGSKALITHRIVYIIGETVVTEGDNPISNGREYPKSQEDCYRLGGDMVDGNADNLVQLVSASMIKGVATSVNPGAGSVLSNIRQNWLFYFVIPVAVILLFEIFLVVKNILDLRNEKNKVALESDKETMMAELEAEKEKMRQELLAELKAQQEAEAKKEATEPTEEVEKETVEEAAIKEAEIEEPTVLDDTKEENTEE